MMFLAVNKQPSSSMQPAVAPASKQMSSVAPSSSSGMATSKESKPPQGPYVPPAPAGQILLSSFCRLIVKIF
jgi:hypothetical protein